MKHFIIFTALSVLTSSLFAANWTWRIPVDMYKNLDFEKRATLDKAVSAYIKAEDSTRHNKSVPDVQIPSYRAAAAEWKKYIVQYELDFDNESVKAYVHFMYGLSLKGARDRNTAISAFEELRDFYPLEEWITPAALFMIGDCYYSNGDTSKAKNTFLEMINDPIASQHPLAARANNRLGWMALSSGKISEAVSYWHGGAAEIFKTTAESDQRDNFHMVVQSYAVAGKWKELMSFIYEDVEKDKTRDMANRVQWVEDIINGNRWRWDEWWYNAREIEKSGSKNKLKKEFDRGYSMWHEEQKSVFLSDNREWEYLRRAFSYRRAYDLNAAKEFIEEMSAYVNKVPNEKRYDVAIQLINCLCDAGMFDEAHFRENLIDDPIKRLWASYNIDLRANKYDGCVLTLEQIIANKDPEISLSGKKSLAWLYKDRIHDYEKALKIYIDISVPPGTLWDIQQCYRHLKRTKEALATLQELTFFPTEAARATWTMAEYHREDGNKEQAVALYRRLLSQPEWKKTSESSWAHQRLEAWGIATGGAVIETIR